MSPFYLPGCGMKGNFKAGWGLAWGWREREVGYFSGGKREFFITVFPAGNGIEDEKFIKKDLQISGLYQQVNLRSDISLKNIHRACHFFKETIKILKRKSFFHPI